MIRRLGGLECRTLAARRARLSRLGPVARRAETEDDRPLRRCLSRALFMPGTRYLLQGAFVSIFIEKNTPPLRSDSGGATMGGARQLSTAAGLRMRLGGLMVPASGPHQEIIVCRPRGRRQPGGGRTRAAPSGPRVHRRQGRRVRPARFLWLAAGVCRPACGLLAISRDAADAATRSPRPLSTLGVPAK
jgi:hypothetical protein